ncbi:MAG TPA: regulatory iron-sulfur-containing complex subunit RicT [Patescibacteria group bacterium]|nr:regulatory iron-sulfur-containing complex subunit RicT [Patescibacteria group bacterium]
MKIIQVQFAPWDKVYNFFNPDFDLKVGDCVIVETEMGKEFGKVVACLDKQKQDRELKPIIRKANYEDVSQLVDDKKKEETFNFCKQAINRLNLPMKLVDVHFSFEGNKINFAFIADGRVDFRDLVKELAARFSANIRLTQIGTRDEAKAMGDCGSCGRSLCCKQFMCEFSSITSEMAETQQVVHRGSDRISGMCGRLMCCLEFEYEGYKELAAKLPPLGTKVKVNGERGVVINHHILKQTVNVRIFSSKANERETVIEVDPFRNKNK